MWLDILIGTLFIIAILQGYRHGLIRAIVSFSSLSVGRLGGESIKATYKN